MKKLQVTLTDREHSAVIAVLRFAQGMGLERMAQMVPGIDAIANNAGQLQPLTQEELGDLAERVNVEAVELTESGRPRDPSVMKPYLDRVNAAFAALGDASIVFSPSHTPKDSPMGDFEAYKGKTARIVHIGTDVTKEPDWDEESLPYYRLEFEDGGEVDAFEEELFSHDPRWLDMMSAVASGFSAARNLGFTGPRNLDNDGDLNHKEEFLIAMKAFNLTECVQEGWTPDEFRRPAREAGTSPSL